MGAMFRSEEMALCQLFIQPEAAYTSVSELGEAGTVQFRDLNPEINAFQRKFVNEVRRCDEMERKLRYIEREMARDGAHPPPPPPRGGPRAPNPREIIDLEAHLEKTENEILELSHNAVNLKQNYLELTELKHVLEKTDAFFLAQEEIGIDSLTKSLIAEDGAAGGAKVAAARGRLGFVAGVVQRERVPAFERMLWRISRGNVFLRRADLDTPLIDPNTGNEIYKAVFVAFFQGEQLKSRIKKVCAGFHASLYPCPPAAAERDDMLRGVGTRLEDLKMVLNQTHDHRQRVLASVAKELASWSIMVRKMKAIYHTLNMFNMDVTKKCLIGECWVPTVELPNVQKALVDGSNACGSSIPSFLNCIETDEEPPTYNRSNRFTHVFQMLVDSYGVASYRECNPALYTIITFPFLFAVMFGDFGHGIILTLFALWMVIKEDALAAKKSKNEIWNIFFGGRYIILLMGLFSIYTGLIYNDIFSKSVNVFGTAWKVNFGNGTLSPKDPAVTLPPENTFSGAPYIFGIDPVWQFAENKIIFLNSYKMKLSIILGVIHMIFGVTMSVFNYNFFRRRYSIWLEFVPQLILLMALFLYLVFMMFFKWIAYSTTAEDPTYKQGCAPSILVLFIKMMMFGKAEGLNECQPYMFQGQETLNRVLIIVALICIPIMLIGKPFYIYLTTFSGKHARLNHTNGDLNQTMEMEEHTDSNGHAKPESSGQNGHGGHGDHGGHGGHGGHNEPFSEVIVHQIIHTIEYVLSTISHTASYLRLWALSLAHSELSEVLWQMVLSKGLTKKGYVAVPMLFFTFAFWAIFTVMILVLMEGLSAFLHTLRLHWVEFMSKFYSGAGYGFQPFCFKTILEQDESEE